MTLCEDFHSVRAQILTRITRIILVLGKSALSVPDTRFSRVSGSSLTFTTENSVGQADSANAAKPHWNRSIICG